MASFIPACKTIDSCPECQTTTKKQTGKKSRSHFNFARKVSKPIKDQNLFTKNIENNQLCLISTRLMRYATDY